MTTSKLKFTEARVRDAAVGTYADEVEPGLMLYVSPTARTWGLYKWSPAERRPIKKSLGKWPTISVDEARKRAKTLSLKLLDGESLTRPSVVLLEDLSDSYLKWGKTRELRRPEWIADVIRLGFSDWLKKDINEITRADLVGRYTSIATGRGLAAAARSIKGIRTLFTYAESVGLYSGPNPAKAVKVAGSKGRERYLSPDEFDRVRAALDDPRFPEWVHPYFTLVLLTGARSANVAAMRWDALDLNEGVWRVPAADSKNGREMALVLVPEAVELLTERRKTVESEWVFPASFRASSSGHLEEPFFRWKEVLRVAGVDSSVTIHDCRRTVGVRLTAAGAPISVVAKVLGHTSISATARSYAFASPESAREWMLKLNG